MSLVNRVLPGNLAGNEISDANVVGGTAPILGKSGATTIFAVYLDNSAGSGDAYLRIWDATSGKVSGTNPAHFIFYAPGNSTRMYTIPLGLTIDTGILYIGANAAGNSGTSAPATTLQARILIT